MSRRHSAEKRVIQPDPVYGNTVYAKFINALMSGGKKTTAEKIFYGAIDILEKEKIVEKGSDKDAGSSVEGPEIINKAIANVKPSMEVRSRRVGGATYPIPVAVTPQKSLALALRWIIKAASERSERTMAEKLAQEIRSAYNETGAAVKKRVDTHKMSESNRAFSHFRW
jgi:small subunit ribosomal protein S7